MKTNASPGLSSLVPQNWTEGAGPFLLLDIALLPLVGVFYAFRVFTR
jgi:hypothetical protein